MIVIRDLITKLALTTSTGADVSWFVSYKDKNNGGEVLRGSYGKTTTATTEYLTDLVTDSLTSGYAQQSRDIEYISVVNIDSTSQTVIISLYDTDGSIDYPLTPEITLNAGDALVYSDRSGWNTVNATGSSSLTEVVTRKTLGQSAPNATTETTLYTVPAGKSCKITALTVCNRSAASVSFRVSISVGGGATANKDYLYYDTELAAYSTFARDVNQFVSEGDIVRVYASTADLSFNISGEEYE